MDDWLEPDGEPHETIAPSVLLRSRAAEPEQVEALAALLEGAKAPALVVGAGADRADTWAALVALAERLRCPVWHECFGARAGFPQDHAQFAGFLPADRGRLRETLGGHDVVLVVGAPVLRQYPFVPGPLVAPGTRVAVVTDEPAEAHRSPAELALLADPAAVCAAVAERVGARDGEPPPGLRRPAPPAPPADGEPLLAGHVLTALADRLPADAVVIEETPSSRPELHRRLPARAPLGFLSAAMGGLGFAVPAAIGLRMAQPRRPVVAVVGDGASLYQVQSLWSAARYGAGALFVVLANGGYRVMDRLAEMAGASGPWPGFEEVDVAAVARGFGCPAERVSRHDELIATLDDVVPGLAERAEPLVLVVDVAPDMAFSP
jgi:benzoylformate decarboxylase